jgi:ferritin-like metal-binding protein YciE
VAARDRFIKTLSGGKCDFFGSPERLFPSLEITPRKQQRPAAPHLKPTHPLEAVMRFHSAHIDNLRKLYVDQIEHLLSVENQIVEALPNVIESAGDPELKRVLQIHLQETCEPVSRLEQIAQQTADKLQPKRSKPVAALIEEANDMIGDAKNDPVRDAMIVAACQRIEHYEIAAYSAVSNFAEIIGETDQSGLLEKTLEEEKKADGALNGIAESANTRADRAA